MSHTSDALREIFTRGASKFQGDLDATILRREIDIAKDFFRCKGIVCLDLRVQDGTFSDEAAKIATKEAISESERKNSWLDKFIIFCSEEPIHKMV
jgi:hypothetical protein